jgi:hypothetical protein
VPAREVRFLVMEQAWAETSKGPPDPARPISSSAGLMFNEDDGARTRNLRRDRPEYQGAGARHNHCTQRTSEK